MKLFILRPEQPDKKVPVVLWMHGGGYRRGFAETILATRGGDLAREFGLIVVSPEYRLSGTAPYPAAVEDCYTALLWLKAHASELGGDGERIIVGGESAGGGLCAALCMMARDRGVGGLILQLPLYPMLDCCDTESSRNNHALIWNTRKNHRAWRKYLGELSGKKVPPYASPSRQTDYRGLPPAYTFLSDGEPFYSETMRYIECLKAAGIPARADVYHAKIHAFDIDFPWLRISRAAKKNYLAAVGGFLNASGTEKR